MHPAVLSDEQNTLNSRKLRQTGGYFFFNKWVHDEAFRECWFSSKVPISRRFVSGIRNLQKPMKHSRHFDFVSIEEIKNNIRNNNDRVAKLCVYSDVTQTSCLPMNSLVSRKVCCSWCPHLPFWIIVSFDFSRSNSLRFLPGLVRLGLDIFFQSCNSSHIFLVCISAGILKGPIENWSCTFQRSLMISSVAAYHSTATTWGITSNYWQAECDAKLWTLTYSDWPAESSNSTRWARQVPFHFA